MRQVKSATSPTLDAKGSFPIFMSDFAFIRRDVVNLPITNTATLGGTNIPMTNTAGLAVGQRITIQDTLNSETGIIATVTTGASIDLATNLVNTYTVARGGQVTVMDVTLPITATATGGGVIIPMTNTLGLQAAQRIIIEDSVGAEECVVNVVTPNVQITVTANLVNSYTVARGGRVSIVNGNPAKASVSMQKPFAAAAGSAQVLDNSFSVGNSAIVVTVQKATAAGGPALPYSWAVAVTADVAGLQFTAVADGE